MIRKNNFWKIRGVDVNEKVVMDVGKDLLVEAMNIFRKHRLETVSLTDYEIILSAMMTTLVEMGIDSVLEPETGKAQRTYQKVKLIDNIIRNLDRCRAKLHQEIGK